MTAMIELKNVTKRYGSATPAVADLNLEVNKGEILVLVGPSGCGKSTTLRLINRMIEPSGGQIFLDGEDVTKSNPDQLRRRIGYVIQQIGLFPHYTIAENIATVPKLLGWDKQRIAERVDQLLEVVGLDPDEYRNRYPSELSGGQAQRVGVARALGADPEIMLMDEPFGAIDPITRDSLQNEFLRVQEELHKTIVFVTHDIDEAIKMGDRIAILGEQSKIRQIDTPERILAFPVDEFVSDFIGNGSTIKGLNFETVESLPLESYPLVRASEGVQVAKDRLTEIGGDWLLLVDQKGYPTKWLHVDDLASGQIDPATGVTVQAVVRRDATLFETLEMMLQSAAGMCCVVDENDELQGVVKLTDLSKVIRTAQREAKEHYEKLERSA